MPLYLPAGIRQIAADQKHPWYHPEIDLNNDLAVFVDGDLIDPMQHPMTVVDEINGFVKYITVGTQGEITFDSLDRIRTTRRKGRVEIFMKKGTANVD